MIIVDETFYSPFFYVSEVPRWYSGLLVNALDFFMSLKSYENSADFV